MLQAVAVREPGVEVGVGVGPDAKGTRGCMSRVCNRERIVWAKLAGYRPWPARMIGDAEREEDPFFQQADGHKRAEDDTLVCFFGSNDLAWVVRKKAIKPWKAGLQQGYENARQKDKTFRFALAQVQQYVDDKTLRRQVRE